MIEPNNPAIDVDDLMSRLQQEVSKRSVGREPLVLDPESGVARGFGAIEALLNTAHAKAEVRTRWSAQLSIFPFRNARLQRFMLKTLAYLFKDQRHVNFALIAALRETLALNRELTQRVTALEAELRQSEGRLQNLEYRR